MELAKMKVKRMIWVSSLAGGIGLASVLGVGLGTASADPGQPCGGPNAQFCQPGPGRDQGPQQDRGPGPQPIDDRGIDQRGIDQGRADHQPFSYMGQHVNPVFDNDHGGWGFWFFNMWIPL
jgi:hypothetical protein